MKEIIETIESGYRAFSVDAGKALAGNKSAAARARKVALELAKNFKEFRKVSIAEGKAE